MNVPTLVLQLTGGSKEHISSIDPQQPGWIEVHGQYFEDRRRLAGHVINCCNSYEAIQTLLVVKDATIAELRERLSELCDHIDETWPSKDCDHNAPTAKARAAIERSLL